MKIQQIKQIIKEEIQKSELKKLIIQEIKEVIKEDQIDFDNFWKEHDKWVISNKYPSWKIQKINMVRISPSFGITLSSSDWNNIFNMYAALFKKSYFINGWDEQVKPWFEKQIIKKQQ